MGAACFEKKMTTIVNVQPFVSALERPMTPVQRVPLVILIKNI